ncbi:hypothetical protein U879_07675 [Defluviimonas sp. 20V17]|uniref:Transcriptional regulator, TetR family n=1 Tax=Allgaiera indica TaxID=765699 RepID=A0AAN5A055_9RHOB|nr:TetR/AcrR family transcriptional regulator [Allgaiera indica]KDB04268.1 hypothetical protein U879_07675 [Defluviimonas sp. 20V17]GHE03684.1 hypothetical protein GCM10008024_28020 [Allgaiera indica]SDX74501.1 transcriptional regulator, TetR family [Allgaiera indica]
MTDKPRTGLRERQKEDRRARIIAAARQLFLKAGPENITIEAIAEIAGVSSVTVHNYYGTKSGVLLALVAESDRELLYTMRHDLLGKSRDPGDLLMHFLSIVCTHALKHLDKVIWRQVIAASVNGQDPRFGKLYHDLDRRLVGVLVEEIRRLQASGLWPAESDATQLGWALFNIQNARFIEFISSDHIDQATALRHLRNDIRALMLEKPPLPTGDVPTGGVLPDRCHP